MPKCLVRPGENILISWKITKLVRSTATGTPGSTSIVLVKPSANAANSSQEAGIVTTGGQSTSTQWIFFT